MKRTRVYSWQPWFWSIYSIYNYIHTMYYSCILYNWDKFFLRDIYLAELVWPWRCDGWYDIVILSSLVSNVYFNCIVQDSLYHNADIGTMWHCVFVSCTPLQSIWLIFVCALFWCWWSLCVPLTNSLIEFCIIMIVVTIIGIFMAIIIIIANYTFRLSETK